MLAYLFWHWPKVAVIGADYESALLDLHAALSDLAPAGLQRSTSWAVGGLPWLPVAAGYADWYLVEDFAALGVLNQAAVSEPCRPAHDRVAGLSGGGSGGLYRLRAGDAGTGASWESWFAEPDFKGAEVMVAGAGRALWQRQLVLGPAPEFCLLSSERASPPGDALTVPRRLVRGAD